MRRIFLLCVSLATIAAWSAGCEPEKEEKDESPDSLTVGPENPTVTVGSSLQLTATAIFADLPSQDVTDLASWSTTTSAIATVNGGLLTALSVGTVRVNASYDLRTGTTLVTVVPTQGAIGFVEVEPNDLFPDEANDVGDEVAFSGSCDDVDFEDYYVAFVNSGTLSVSIAWTEGPAPEADLDLYLYDVDFNELGIPDAEIPPGDTPAEVTAILPSAMMVYINVYYPLLSGPVIPYTGTITRP